MGEGAGVPIEPDEQTALADATASLPGVLAAGVPGAGTFKGVVETGESNRLTCFVGGSITDLSILLCMYSWIHGRWGGCYLCDPHPWEL